MTALEQLVELEFSGSPAPASDAGGLLLAGADEPGRLGPASEEALLAAARAGERGAQQELYRKHADRVYRRLSRLLGPVPEREDLLQQVFFEALRGLPRFRGESLFSTYLYRITSNLVCSHLRRCPRVTTCDCSLLDDRDSGQPSPEHDLLQRESLAQIWRLLDQIKPKKRIAYLLRVVEGLSLEEIALQVGARPAAVGMRIAHAQRELLRLLAREQEERP